MSVEVTLTVIRGPYVGKEYTFHNRTLCTVGRGLNCLLQLPNDLVHLDVSRRHCLFDFDPPGVRVRDLGSRNGTYVNEQNIGQRARGLPPGSASGLALPERILEDGDEIRVGSTVFRLHIAGQETAAAEEGERVLETNGACG